MGPGKKLAASKLLVPPGDNEITAAAYAAGGQVLVFATYNVEHEAEIWRLDLPRAEPTEILSGETPNIMVSALAVSPKADVSALSMFGEKDQYGAGSTTLWYLERLEQLKVLTGDPSFSLAISSDAKLLASGHSDGAIKLWHVKGTDAEPVSLEGHSGVVTSVAFSPDGKWLASGSSGKRVLLWDVATGQQLSAPLDVYRGDNVEVVFSPNGRSWHRAPLKNPCKRTRPAPSSSGR